MVTDTDGPALVSRSPGDTRTIGRAVGGACSGGETVLLYGDLGSGKTCFAQGLAQGLGVPGDVKVASPTFTLHGRYRGRLWFDHVDLYRLEGAAEAAAIGIEEMLSLRDAVLAVEWPEEVEEMVAGNCLRIRIEHLSPDRRLLRLAAEGEAHRRLLRTVASALEAMREA